MIYCCECQKDVEARLTDGAEIYPHRKDLYSLPFWKCDECQNFVGCHHKTKDRTKPLGHIPTKEMKKARQHIHMILDPLWKSKKIGRRELYKKISDILGWEFHVSHTRSVEECRDVYKAVKGIALELERE